MEEKISDELKSFLDCGIYRLDGSKVVFVDPVRLLNDSYSRFRISPSSYYSRSFQSVDRERVEEKADAPSTSKKKRKRKKRPRDLNEREKSAEKRHQVILLLPLSLYVMCVPVFLVSFFWGEVFIF